MSGPDSYPEIGSSDRRHLIEESDDEGRSGGGCSGFARRHRRCLVVFSVLAMIALGHIVAVYFIYFRCNAFNNCSTIRVMALNTWGMPRKFGSEYKEERMASIADELSKGHYDIYLFEELWMQPDHTTVAAKVPEGYHMTAFRELALWDCDGRVAPTLCSGLAVASRFPLVEKEFNSYTEHGDAAKAAIDGEWFARKGVGRVRIRLPQSSNITVDVFITHTAADPDPHLHNYTNAYYRKAQVKELMTTYVNESKADVVLLGGDFNAGPIKKEGEVYHTIRQFMTNCFEELFYSNGWWLDPQVATYGNAKNTFSNKYAPIVYDYIFHMTNDPSVRVWTNWIDIAILKMKLAVDKLVEKTISLSDHEAVTSTIHIRSEK